MAEQVNPLDSPTSNIQLDVSAGLVDPRSLDITDIKVPDPPQSYPTGVMSTNMIPTQKQVGPSTSQQGAQRLRELGQTASSWANNPTYYSKVKAYNSDYDGANYKRYAALPSVYKKYGFTPFRDNEELYNKEASWFSRYGRSFYASTNLAQSAFTDMLPWNTWRDWNDPNMTSAKDMARWHAIGHDSKGGLGSWVNNMTVDFGYTGGIIAEIAAEEVVIWGAGLLASPETGFTSLGLAATQAGRNIKRAFNLYDKFKDVQKGITTTFDWLKTSDKANDFWKFTKTYAGKGLTGLGKAILPETFKYGQQLAKDGKSFNKALKMVEGSKTFGAFYRDVRAYTAVVSESKLEGGSTELDVRDSLIDEFYKNKGVLPTGDDLARIYEEAGNAGRQAFYWNLPALWISNKIVFDKALRGWKPMSAFREELEKGIKGKLVYDEALGRAGKAAWKAVDDGWKGTWKTLTTGSTYRPKNLINNAIGSFVNYSKANITEGLQEVYQDVVQNTMTDYYKDRFHNFYTTGSRSVFGSFYDHMKNIDPGRALETFSSGYFMGSMAKFPQKLLFDTVPEQFHKWFKREDYKQWRDTQVKNTKSIVDALNAATENNGFWDAITENTVSQITNQREADMANEANDKRSYYTITDDSVYQHLHTLMRFGKLDLIKDQIKDMKGLDAKGLQEAFGPMEGTDEEVQREYQSRLDSFMKKADMVSKMYTETEEKYGNPFNPKNYNRKTDPEGYEREYNAYIGWEEAKKAAVKSSYDFFRTTGRMKSVMDELVANKPVAESVASEYMMALNTNTLDLEIESLKGNKAKNQKGLIEVYREGDEESQKKADEFQNRLDILQRYKDAIEDYKKAVEIDKARQTRVVTPEQEATEKGAKVKEGTKVKNKKGREAVVAKIKRGKAYDENGGLIGKVKSLEILEGEKEEDMLTSATQELYDSYREFVKYISRGKGEVAMDSGIDESFMKLKDYYALGVDRESYAAAVDILHNPSKFTEYASRIAQLAGELKRQNKAKIEESYKKFLAGIHKSQLFSELYKMGVFVDEKGMEAILEEKVPSVFYFIAGEKEMVPFESDTYKKILDLFEKYEAAQGVRFSEKPIPEEEARLDSLMFSGQSRNKIKGDNRTYEDLAKEYGFNPDPSVETKINTREILQKIINSSYSTYREKALARRLLSIVSKDSVITFKKLNKGGFFQYTSDAKVGTFMDPRYYSSDYRGDTKALETVILHELIHEITSFEMSKNAQFKAAVKKLMDRALKEYETKRPSDAMVYGSAVTKPFYGLKNEDEFLAEMFTNPRFAAWLDTIEYETTGTTVWKEFLNMLQYMLSQILGVTKDNTLLKEALNIATSYIETIHGQSIAQPERIGEKIRPGRRRPSTGPAVGTLNPGSSINEYRSAGVLPALIQSYRDFVKDRTGANSLTAEQWPDQNVANKTDDEVANSPEFRQYLQMGSTDVQRTLNDYNRTKVAPQPQVRPQPQPVTRSRLDHLKELVKMKSEGVNLANFFENLEWTTEGAELWAEMQKHNVRVLTGGRELAPGADPISTGKRAWAKKNLNLEGDDVIVEKQKQNFAAPNTILIDDLPENVRKFREAGGNAILHTNKEQTLKELREHMANNPDHLIYTDLDGVLVDLAGGVAKFRQAQATTPAPAVSPVTPVGPAGTVEITPEKEAEIINAVTEEDYIASAEGITQEGIQKARGAERQRAIADAKAAAKYALDFISGKIDAKNYLNRLGYDMASLSPQDIIDLSERESAYWRSKLGPAPQAQPVATETAVGGAQAAAAEDTTPAEYAQKKQLTSDLGYNWNEVNRMTKSEAQYLIDNDISAEQLAESKRLAEESARRASQQEEQMLYQATMQELEQMIADSDSKSELDAAESAISIAIHEDEISVADVTRLEGLIEQRKQQLARDIKYEDIEENTSLIMKNGSRVVVVKKENNTLYLRPYGQPGGRVFTVKADKVKEKILYKDQPFVEQFDVIPPIDPETQTAASQVINDAMELNTTDSVNEDLENARTATTAEVEDDFDNSLGCQ